MEIHDRPMRSSSRLRRRLKVTFLGSSSFTFDVGRGGFSTRRARVFLPGAPVEGTICAAGTEHPFRGRIAWSRPGDLTLGLRGGMGVAFTNLPPELGRALGSELTGTPAGGAPRLRAAPPGPRELRDSPAIALRTEEVPKA